VYSAIVGYSSRWVGSAAAALLLCLVCGSCAAVTGLDRFSQGGCDDDCDGGADQAALSRNVKSAAADASPANEEATIDVDANLDDGPGAEEATDANRAAEPDAQSEASAGEPDSGCGLGTATSCSACGVACSTSTGTPACKGSTCSYACNTGRQDCNAAKAPDTDGCECAGTGCCAGKCQTAHSNGKSNSYYDCSASGTYNQGQAAEACAALAGSSACSSSTVPCNCLLVLCGSQAQSVCASSGGKCYCWQYAGPNAGTVQETNGSSCSASCGSTSDSAWN
jgi:hypothetical protein